MRITCLHGYFICREDFTGEVAQFNSFYDQDLVAKDDYYTFELLSRAPDYSLVTVPYLGVPAIKTFEGKIWDVMRQNQLTYNCLTGLLQNMASIGFVASFSRRYAAYSSRGLIQPGSLTENGQIIKGYQCVYDSLSQTFYYTELFYE